MSQSCKAVFKGKQDGTSGFGRQVRVYEGSQRFTSTGEFRIFKIAHRRLKPECRSYDPGTYNNQKKRHVL